MDILEGNEESVLSSQILMPKLGAEPERLRKVGYSSTTSDMLLIVDITWRCLLTR